MSTKTNTYLSPNTLSGAVKLRDECGMHWDVEDNKPIFDNLIKTIGYTIQETLYEKDKNFSTSKKIQHVTLDHNALTSSTEGAIIPLYRAPMRMYGESTAFLTDTEWKDYVGQLYSERAYGVFNFKCTVPYTSAESNFLEQQGSPGGYSTFSIVPKYNYYLEKYEKYVESSFDDRSIVDINNLMLSTTFNSLEELSSSSGLNAHIYNFLTREINDSGSLLLNCFEATPDTILPPEHSSDPQDTADILYEDKSLRMREYLNNFFIEQPVSAPVAAMNSMIMRNIYFGKNEMNKYILDGYGLGRSNLALAFPYYNQIDVDLEVETKTNYRQIIEDNNFSEQLLHNLRVTFKDYAFPILTSQPYTVIQEQDSFDTDNKVITSEARSSTVLYKSCNAIDLLKRSYNVSFDIFADPNFSAFNVFGPQRQDTSTDGIPDFLYHLTEVTGSMRFFRTESALETLNEFIVNIDDTSVSSPFECSEDYKGNSLYALYQSAENEGYKETIAYRLSKTDTATGNAIQDWWFYNLIDMATSPTLSYQDSQVKYGRTYTYTMYAYKLVGGIRYRLGDMILTRKIGTTIVGSNEYNCLEFYNPNTNEYSPMLFSGASGSFLADLSTTSSVATPAQIYTDQSYLADLNLYYEPALDIVEVPIGTKNCTVLDHPANVSEVVPFQVLNDSQQIGFHISYGDFQHAAAYQNGNFPTILPDDYADRYQNSYDIVDNNYETESPSKPIAIQVYRSVEKPKSYDDMVLYKTIQINDEQAGEDVDLVSDYIFYDKISTNIKYYYAFSFLNEHQINGNPGPIIEAELVDDGGYKYSLFNSMFKEDLNPEPTPAINLQFKKLMQILPAIRQLRFNTTEVDYSLTGNENLNLLGIGDVALEQSIWNKQFKIRLTSKKTGRMIDINLSFNIEEEKY